MTMWNALLLLAVLAMLIGAVHAIMIAPTALRLTRIDAPIDDLAPELEGYTLAILSDLHYGGTIAPARMLSRAVQLANESTPDVIVLLGDYALSHSKLPGLSRSLYRWALPRMTGALSTLHAPDGVIAILGNHDYDDDVAIVIEWLRALGATVLVNACVTVRRGQAILGIGGVDDFTNGEIDPDGGCATLPPEVPRIVLSHNPDGACELSARARVDLVIAGHTHGGQVVLPRIGAPMRHCSVCDAHSASGWVARSPVPLYVTTGAGVVMPLRVNCPAEVLLVRLVRH
jgi:hypothetical protein